MASTPATPLRLAVAGLIHETNTYAAEFAGQTPLRAFEQYSGQDQILQAFDRSNHQVGGFIEGARQAGAELVCAYVGQATPSGTIEAQAYAQMKRRILDGLRAALPVDGVLLALHGAGVADGVEDIEGDLCVAVRELVGPATPIAAVYDLHGNMTEAMRDSCELTLPCKLYPHTDFHDRGVEAVALLREIIAGRLRPVTVMRRLPMLPYIVTTQEGFIPPRSTPSAPNWPSGPASSTVHGFTVFPTRTSPRRAPPWSAPPPATLRWPSAAPTKSRNGSGRARELPPVLSQPGRGRGAALAAAHGPVVVNEYADNPGGGTPGDGTHLLRAVLDAQPAPGTCCFASINDASVVDQARQAGVGATISVSLGGKQGRFQGEPLRVNAYVKAITDGRFINRAGSMFEGVRFDLGAMCRLLIQGVDVIVASRAEQIYDEEPFFCTASTSTRTSSSPSRGQPLSGGLSTAGRADHLGG